MSLTSANRTSRAFPVRVIASVSKGSLKRELYGRGDDPNHR
jgi:hypothetical protein